ncbi:MAG: tetratricopeptide repeat protein [Isosphaeraceae bacterium]
MSTLPQALDMAWKHYQAGQLHAAEQLFGQILQSDPGHLDALNLLGVIAHRTGRHEAAMDFLTRALKINPDFAQAHYNLGIMLRAAGKVEEAVASFRQAIRLQPDSAPAHNNLAEALLALPNHERLAEAVSIYQQALRLKPDLAEAHNNLGTALHEQGRLEEAVSSYLEALRLKPDFAEAHNNLGATLHEQGRLEEATSSYLQALHCNPAFAAAHTNLGRAQSDVGKVEEALASHEQAIRFNPGHVDAHLNRSMCWLLLGDFERGWPEFEWRWQTKEAVLPPFSRAPWDGSSLAGRTILLHTEQGLGDTLQFVRYASRVKERGGTVLLRCSQALLRLLGSARGIDRLIAENDRLPAFDVDAPLLCLPKVFGTSLATVPAEIPYLFADPNLAEHWRVELDRYPGFRIGIAWQGNPKHKNDRRRSFPLAQFAPVAGLGGVRLFSLQMGPGHEQLSLLDDRFLVVDLGSRFGEAADSFMDAAAVMKNLDLVISVDSAVAHLAGALGVPAWVALPFAPDWRWLVEREDSPWYPTMRLFRQSRPGDWAGVFERITGELQRLLAIEPGLRGL